MSKRKQVHIYIHCFLIIFTGSDHRIEYMARLRHSMDTKEYAKEIELLEN